MVTWVAGHGTDRGLGFGETEATDETEGDGGSGTRGVRPYNSVRDVLNPEIPATYLAHPQPTMSYQPIVPAYYCGSCAVRPRGRNTTRVTISVPHTD